MNFLSNLLADLPTAAIIIVAVGAAALIGAVVAIYFLARKRNPENEDEEAVADAELARNEVKLPPEVIEEEKSEEQTEEVVAEEVVWEGHPAEEPQKTFKEEPKQEAKPKNVLSSKTVEEEPEPEAEDDEYWETDPELLYDENGDYYDEPETEEERAAEEAAEAEEAPAIVKIAEGDHYIIKRYQRGFMAKLIQSEKMTKVYYTEIKNELLSYADVKSRETWNHESFIVGRSTVAKITLRGNMLALYLAINPKQVIAEGRYAVDDVSTVAAHASTPTLYRIKNSRRLGGSKQLIKTALKGHEKNEKFRPINWARKLPYEENDALAERGIVKVTVEEVKA